MPKGKYLNADHEIIGKLIEQMDGLSNEEKIHDVLCALIIHDFHSPEQHSVFNYISPTPLNKGSSSVSPTDTSRINEYLTIELGQNAGIDSDAILMAKMEVDKAKTDGLDISTIFKKQKLDFNISFSNQYYEKKDLGIKQQEYNINLSPIKKEAASKRKKEKQVIKEPNFINDNIEDFAITFGDHFSGKNIQEIIDKDLSRNIVSRMFRWDSDQMSNVFKALKEIDNPKSKLSNGKKAANLRDALHDYLEYKRPAIQTQLDNCENDAERRKLIEKNNVDFRRYEFCRKLAEKMKDFPYEFRDVPTKKDLNYKQYTAYEHQFDAVSNGIKRIQKKEKFSLGRFFKEKISEPISDFFSSLFSRRSKSNTNVGPVYISSRPNVSERTVHEEPRNNTKTEIKNEIVRQFNTEKNQEKVNNNSVHKQQLDLSKADIKKKPTYDHPFTEKDEAMIKDLFNNSSGSTKDKLIEIAMLSRMGLIGYENNNNAMNLLGLNTPFQPARTVVSTMTSPLVNLSNVIAGVVKADLGDVPSKSDFEDKYLEVSSIAGYSRSENKHIFSKDFGTDKSVFKTGVFETAAKYDKELKNEFDNKLLVGKKRLNIVNDEYRQEQVDVSKIKQEINFGEKVK